MARRGPKGRSPEEAKAAGETRASRKVVSLYPDVASRPDPDVIKPPSWLLKVRGAKALWNEKIARYRQRGQKVEGFEAGLAQYCALEAQLADWYSRGIDVPAAKITQHRVLMAEFYDTPASQRVPASSDKGKGNVFARNGQPRAGGA